MLLGEENGDVHGYEWNESDEVFFEPQTRMKMLGYSDSIQSVRITDLDQSQVSDMVVVTEDEAHWLYGQTLQNLVTYNVAENVETTWYSHTDNAHRSMLCMRTTLLKSHLDRLTRHVGTERIATRHRSFTCSVNDNYNIDDFAVCSSEWYVVNTVGVLVGSESS